MTRRTLFALTWAAVTLLASGCGGKNKLHKVDGVVTYKGEPLAGATVQFIPQEGKGAPASGVTGDDGSFRLTTFNTGDGAKPGDYKVVITVGEARDPTGGPPNMNDPDAMKRAMVEFSKTQRNPGEKKKPAVHPNYSTAEKTPLRQQVPPDGTVELKLTAAGN